MRTLYDNGKRAVAGSGTSSVCGSRGYVALVLVVLASLPAIAQSDQQDTAANLTDRIVPLATQVALGALVGYLVGVLIKKVGKVLAFVVVAAFALLQVLASSDLIDLGPVTAVFDRLMGDVEDRIPSAMDVIAANIPAVIGGVIGLLVGLRSRSRKRMKDDGRS